MEIMSQERYQEYRNKLKEDGYPYIETIVNFPDENTYKILEDRFGPMPWNLLKFPINNLHKE